MNDKGKNIGAVIFVGLLILFPFAQVFLMLYDDFKRSIELSSVTGNTTATAIWIYSVFGLLALALLAFIMAMVNGLNTKKKVDIEGNNIIFYKKDLFRRNFFKTKEMSKYDIDYIRKDALGYSGGTSSREGYNYYIVDKQGKESFVSELDAFENQRSLVDYLINELNIPVKEKVDKDYKKYDENEQYGKENKVNDFLNNITYKLVYFSISFVIVLVTSFFNDITKSWFINNDIMFWISIFAATLILTIIFLKSVWARRIVFLLLLLYVLYPILQPILYSKAP